MERLFSILTRKAIKKHVASMLVVVMVLSQNMIAGAEVGSFTGETKRIKSAKGCQHNCWTDEGCQELLWQIMDADPEAYDEIREEMLAYGWDDSGYGPGFATDSDADEIEDAEQEKATPSDAEEKTDGKATPSNADEKKPEKATPSDADEKATDSDADEKVNSKYRITDDGRLKLRACEHEHDDECGYYAWKTTYQYEDEEVKVKAVVVSEKEEALPDGSELVVEKVTEPEDIEYIAQKIAEETGRLYDCSQAYDIRFEFGGDEVEPEDATVKVQLKYKEAVPVNEPGEVQAGEEAGNDIRVLHLTHDNQIEDVTGDISKNMAGDLKSATFETESFSIFVLTQVLPNGTFFQYEDEEKVITASVSNAAEIPSDAKLVVDVIGEEDERYVAAAEQLAQTTGLEGNSQRIAGTDLLMYEFYFLDFFDEKIELPEDVSVGLDITFKNMQFFGSNTNESNLQSISAGTESEVIQPQVSVYQMDSYNNINLLSSAQQVSDTGNLQYALNLLGTSPVLFGANRSSSNTDTMTGTYGGEYSLDYILNHFQYFVNGNVTSLNHTIGPIAVKGTMSFQPSGSWGSPKYVHQIPSYIEGEANFQGEWGPMWPAATSVKKVYLGEVNAGKEPEWWGQPATYISKNNCFIDFEEAFQSLNAETKSYVADVIIDSNQIDDVRKGQTYDNEYYRIYKDGGNGSKLTIDFKTASTYRLDSFKNIDVFNVIKDESAETDALIISMDNSETINMPLTWINGVKGFDAIANGEVEVGEGLGVAYLFPNATGTVNLRSTQRHIGHVVAPNAKVTMGTGDYNGCLIARELHLNSEGHMWPYNGTKLNTSVQFKLGKTIDNGDPESESFDFDLQRLDTAASNPEITINGIGLKIGAVVDTKTNHNREIAFGTIGFSAKGDYYYRVYEKQPVSGNSSYIYDTNAYYIRVTVGETTQNINGKNKNILVVENVDYWKADINATEITDNSIAVNNLDGDRNPVTVDLVQTAVFNNRSKDKTSAQIKLGKKVIRNDLKASTVPTDAEKFNFTLQPMQITTDASTAEITIDGVDFMLSGTPDIKQNSGGEIAFEAMPYSAAGDYYYKITENSSDNQPVGAQSGYIFDTNYYYIKIKVQDIRGKLTVSGVTYWKADAEKTLSAPVDLSENLTGNPVLIDLTTQAVFENKTKEGVVLPETGSTGTRKFTYTGFWLFMMGLMGMMYSGQERKRKVRN